MSQARIFGLAVGIVALIAVGGVLMRKNPAPMVPGDNASATSTPDTTSGSTTGTSKPLSPASSTAPSLNRSISYSSDLSAEVKTILSADIARLQASLAKNYSDYTGWMNLALKYKMAGDYQGTKQIWEFISNLYIDDAVALHNLGDLHHHYLKDYPKSEMYFLRAIEISPTTAINYSSLHELYRYSFKQNSTAGADILKKGIAAVSRNETIMLYTQLAAYYESKGDKTNAKSAYIGARDAAKAAGDVTLTAQLDALIAAL